MAKASTSVEPAHAAHQYVVVARRYRPQGFDELIGQEHVAQALSNAIGTNRVGHAYLFTGARGVGKTSSARILAKALNCVTGPSATPCNQCDICQSISSGDDVDVLEIDGASNRGIDEIRQLRQNVNVRPSRSRFKVYIIDEVHMLTREAFNALLKTLEEPPEHVKFIFCTTEPTKIPITILSRCQRFDFAGINWNSIAERLRAIVESEGVEAEPEALQLLARRAAGSMRDSQSLLEQLLAFSSGKITTAEVHAMLGSADEERLATLAKDLVDRQSAAALAEFDAAVQQGVDPSLLVEQLFGYFRDCMLAVVGCPADAAMYALPSGWPEAAEIGKRFGLGTLMAAMQILDQTLSRLRYSTQGRMLAELALVRICQLEDLEELGNLIAALESGVSPAAEGGGAQASPGLSPSGQRAAAPESPTSSALKKNVRTASTLTDQPDSGPAEPAAVPASTDATQIWAAALDRMSGMVVEQARQFERARFADADRLVVTFRPGYAVAKRMCELPEQLARFEKSLAQVAGRPLSVEFEVHDEDSAPAGPVVRPISPQQRLLETMKNPFVQRASELFGAEPVKVDEPATPS
jgi:DNA polymerase III subunit gamma/tau